MYIYNYYIYICKWQFTRHGFHVSLLSISPPVPTVQPGSKLLSLLWEGVPPDAVAPCLFLCSLFGKRRIVLQLFSGRS